MTQLLWLGRFECFSLTSLIHQTSASHSTRQLTRRSEGVALCCLLQRNSMSRSGPRFTNV